MDECSRGIEMVRQLLAKYQQDYQVYERELENWNQMDRTLKKELENNAVHYRDNVRGKIWDYEYVTGCGDDCKGGYSEVRKTYCSSTVNYSRRCRPTQETISAWEESKAATIRRDMDPGPKPEPPPVPQLGTIVCQDCRQFMNISGSNFSAQANQQLQQCILHLDNKKDQESATKETSSGTKAPTASAASAANTPNSTSAGNATSAASAATAATAATAQKGAPTTIKYVVMAVLCVLLCLTIYFATQQRTLLVIVCVLGMIATVSAAWFTFGAFI